MMMMMMMKMVEMVMMIIFPNQHMMYIELRVCLIIGFYTRFNIAMKYYQGK